jgi:hypothetical protein
MFDERKRRRFEELRRREQEGVLSDAEREEVAALTGELLSAESAYLGPATERLRHQRETLEAQNRKLDALASRKAALVERRRSFLSVAEAERRAIDGEVDALLAGSQDPSQRIQRRLLARGTISPSSSSTAR